MTPKKSWISLAVAGTSLVVVGGLMVANTDVSNTSSSTIADEETAEVDVSTVETASLATSAFWDSSQTHSISLSYDDADYDAMIETYLATGDKEWITATVVIDGTTFEDVGLKLKGNSSLRGLSTDADAELSTEDPASLPWIINLDKFVDDQDYDGATEIVVRGNSTETALNEALALELLEASGLAAEQAVAVEFEVDGESSLRLVIENPNNSWADREFENADALYKAESGGDYSYLGDDPSAYDEVFDQEAGDDDLVPLMAFLQFINESDDETFAVELDQWLDVDSFATYLAFQELVGNFDDIDGPGNNSYLAYDGDTGLMTVASWDLNLSFGVTNNDAAGAGQAAGQVRGEESAQLGVGEMPSGVAGQASEGGSPPPFAADASGALPGSDTDELPAEGELPEPPAGEADQVARGAVGAAAGGGAQGSNILSERFLENAEFSAAYEAELDRLSELLFTSGLAQSALDEWSEVLIVDASGLVSSAVVDEEAASVVQSFPLAS
ncbi:CotH kinase family protein [Microbacterium marmarense]|uniref:CotH kinase family protein n=1 Tax=Microbacterium marmarense TaxID=3122051 RepID=A0ABU8LSD2_9MICO